MRYRNHIKFVITKLQEPDELQKLPKKNIEMHENSCCYLMINMHFK